MGVFGKQLIADSSGWFAEWFFITGSTSWFWTRYYEQLVQKQLMHTNKLFEPANLPNISIR